MFYYSHVTVWRKVTFLFSPHLLSKLRCGLCMLDACALTDVHIIFTALSGLHATQVYVIFSFEHAQCSSCRGPNCLLLSSSLDTATLNEIYTSFFRVLSQCFPWLPSTAHRLPWCPFLTNRKNGGHKERKYYST